jgi:DNA sulfur modification protein DndD
MRINRITLNNFRIYKGLNTIDFEQSEEDKNITVIAGQNGFGKTTFLTALVWGFYGKLIGEVDEKYKREIYELGGYKKYANSILNREVKLDLLSPQSFSVEIEISNVYIPSVPCRKITIRREYDLVKESERVSILIV